MHIELAVEAIEVSENLVHVVQAFKILKNCARHSKRKSSKNWIFRHFPNHDFFA